MVDCLLANFNNASLLMTGMRALGNLALYLPNIPAIVSGGGVQAIVAGLTVHAKNVPLVQIAVGVLTNLVWGIYLINMLLVMLNNMLCLQRFRPPRRMPRACRSWPKRVPCKL